MGFLASYYFTIREENINRSRLMTNIDYAEQLLDLNMPQDALKKYQELLTKVSKEVEPQKSHNDIPGSPGYIYSK